MLKETRSFTGDHDEIFALLSFEIASINPKKYTFFIIEYFYLVANKIIKPKSSIPFSIYAVLTINGNTLTLMNSKSVNEIQRN